MCSMVLNKVANLVSVSLNGIQKEMDITQNFYKFIVSIFELLLYPIPPRVPLSDSI